jgi:translation elongation factor EF-4
VVLLVVLLSGYYDDATRVLVFLLHYRMPSFFFFPFVNLLLNRYLDLREALEKLQLNDAALKVVKHIDMILLFG